MVDVQDRLETFSVRECTSEFRGLLWRQSRCMGGHADDGRAVYRAIFLIAYLCLGHVQMPIADRLQVGALYTGM